MVRTSVMVIFQGVPRPPVTPNGSFVLEGAGFQVDVKTPRPADPAEPE
jgi:hypothetical protein